MKKMARRSGPTHVKVTLLVPVGLWKDLAGAAATAEISRAEFARRALGAAVKNPQIHAPRAVTVEWPVQVPPVRPMRPAAVAPEHHRPTTPFVRADPAAPMTADERFAFANHIRRNAGVAEISREEFLADEARRRDGEGVADDGESGVEGE